VQAFLDRRLNFPEIAAVIEAVVTKCPGGPFRGLDDVLAADAEGRVLAGEWILSRAGRSGTKSESVRGARA
jgi:1-deoxy-D-xylulose-5-phosphate reductoisomerase